MKVRKFVLEDLKRVYEIENMSFNQSYEINIFKQLYEMGVGFLVAEKDVYRSPAVACRRRRAQCRARGAHGLASGGF